MRRAARGLAAGACALALLGCARGGVLTDRPTGLTLVPAPGGLIVEGTGSAVGTRIDFGRAEAGVLAAVARATGQAPRLSPCAAPGRKAWEAGDGLLLVMEAPPYDPLDGARLVGWRRGGEGSGGGCA
jgi:hypothetical protein